MERETIISAKMWSLYLFPEITIHRWLWTASNLQLMFQKPLSVFLELGSLEKKG
jgi:hypothetical protein